MLCRKGTICVNYGNVSPKRSDFLWVFRISCVVFDQVCHKSEKIILFLLGKKKILKDFKNRALICIKTHYIPNSVNMLKSYFFILMLELVELKNIRK